MGIRLDWFNKQFAPPLTDEEQAILRLPDNISRMDDLASLAIIMDEQPSPKIVEAAKYILGRTEDQLKAQAIARAIFKSTEVNEATQKHEFEARRNSND